MDGNNNNKPEIRTKIEYSFCVKVDQEIKGNQSYFRSPLNDKAVKQLAGDLAKWNRDNDSPKSEATMGDDIEEETQEEEKGIGEAEDDPF